MLVVVATFLTSMLMVHLAILERDDEFLSDIWGTDRQNYAYFFLWSAGPPAEPQEGEPGSFRETPLSPEEASSLIDQIRDLDPGAVVTYNVVANVREQSTPVFVTVVEHFQPELLVQGHTPGPGEVVLSESKARDLGLSIGDLLQLESINEYESPALEVVGISKEANASSSARVPDVTAVGVESLATLGASAWKSLPGETGTATGVIDGAIGWNGDVPEHSSLNIVTDLSHDRSGSLLEGAITAGLIATAAMALIAAVTAGRSQGGARRQWMSSVRAMGASRSDVAIATLTEFTVFGLAASAAGFGLGSLTAHLIVNATGGNLAGGTPALTAPIAFGVLGLGTLTSALMSLGPMLAAATTSPSEGLKGSPTQARHSRNSPSTTTWLLVIALGVAATALIPGSTTDSRWLLATAAPIVFGIYIVSTTTLRRFMPALASALSRKGGRLGYVVSIEFDQSPKSAVQLGSVVSLFGSLSGGAVWWWATQTSESGLAGAPGWQAALEASRLAALLAYGTLTIASVVFALGIVLGRGTLVRETAILGALGLGQFNRQLAAVLRMVIPAAAGGALGLLIGTAVAWSGETILWMRGQLPSPPIPGGLTGTAHAFLVGTGALAGVVLAALTVSLAAARVTAAREPVKAALQATRSGNPM